MKGPTFLEGVAVALVAAIVGSGFFHLGMGLLGLVTIPLLVTLLALAYVFYLVTRSGNRIGKVTTLLVWGLFASLLWMSSLSLPLLVMGHLGAVWMIRSIHFHKSISSSLMDLGLLGVGIATSVWALDLSGSLFLTLWTFFLTQALFSSIPAHFLRGRPESDSVDNGFEQASRTADAALRRLSSTQ